MVIDEQSIILNKNNTRYCSFPWCLGSGTLAAAAAALLAFYYCTVRVRTQIESVPLLAPYAFAAY